MLHIGPYEQKALKTFLRQKVKWYRILYAFVFGISVLWMGLWLHGNYQLYYIQDDFYVYDDVVFRILPDADDEIDDFNEFNIDTIKPAPQGVVDLRPYFSAIKNQGKQGACLAFSFSSIAEYTMNTQHKKNVDFSEAFLYYETRRYAGCTAMDIGSTLSDAANVLLQEGICLESFMPYNEYDYTTPPTSQAFSNAQNYKVEDIYLIQNDLDVLRTVLYNGYPIAISTVIFSSFGSGKNGIIPMPQKREIQNYQYSGRTHGYHAMVIVGYDDDKKHFIVRNSWGNTFGDDGYCYMPYDYVTDASLCTWAGIITSLLI